VGSDSSAVAIRWSRSARLKGAECGVPCEGPTGHITENMHCRCAIVSSPDWALECRRLASPTIENSNRLLGWLRGMDKLMQPIESAA
jgi:hypothetical protein